MFCPHTCAQQVDDPSRTLVKLLKFAYDIYSWVRFLHKKNTWDKTDMINSCDLDFRMTLTIKVKYEICCKNVFRRNILLLGYVD
jgi:hypothetical protein